MATAAGSGADAGPMTASYDPFRVRWRPSLPGPILALWVVVVASTARWGSGGLMLMQLGAGVLLIAVWVTPRSDRVRGHQMLLIAATVGLVLGVLTLARVHRPPTSLEVGMHRGWARVVAEPRPMVRGLRVLIEVEGQRLEAVSATPEVSAMVAQWLGGQQVLLSGEIRPLTEARLSAVAWRHVVGGYRIDLVEDQAPGHRLGEASNRFRRAITAGASVLPARDAALFGGLVIGDRSGHTPEMISRYAASGLSHVMVVSGLNVSLLLLGLRPVLERMPPRVRWVATVVVLGWFLGLTRAEPSILRAATMAGLTATAVLRGGDRAGWRMLWVAVLLLVAHDPALAHSLGFWLSVGATGGVCLLGMRIAEGLGAVGPLSGPLGITLGAQIGVLAPMLLVLGSVPLWSVPANLAAVPVASAVKVYGLPAAALAGVVPAFAEILMFPVRAAVRWIDMVATFSAAAPSGGILSAVVWSGWSMVAVWALGRRPAKNRFRDGRASDHRK